MISFSSTFRLLRSIMAKPIGYNLVMPVKFWQTIFRFWFFLNYLIMTVWRDSNVLMFQNKLFSMVWKLNKYFVKTNSRVHEIKDSPSEIIWKQLWCSGCQCIEFKSNIAETWKFFPTHVLQPKLILARMKKKIKISNCNIPKVHYFWEINIWKYEQRLSTM